MHVSKLVGEAVASNIRSGTHLAPGVMDGNIKSVQVIKCEASLVVLTGEMRSKLAARLFDDRCDCALDVLLSGGHREVLRLFAVGSRRRRDGRRPPGPDTNKPDATQAHTSTVPEGEQSGKESGKKGGR